MALPFAILLCALTPSLLSAQDASAVPGDFQAISEAQAVRAALAQNPTIRVADLSVDSSRAGVRANADLRTPTFRANLEGGYRESFAGTSDGAVRNSSQSLSLGLGIDWQSAVGTMLSVDLSSAASWRIVNITPGTSTTVSIGPNYDAQLLLSIRQPILRGAGRDAVLASLREAEAAYSRANAQRDAEISSLAAQALSTFWELWYAERALEVQEEALRLAERQLEEARAQVEIGTLAQTDALRFESELATLRVSTREQARSVTTQQLALAQLMADQAPELHTDPSPPELGRLPSLEELLRDAESRSLPLIALQAQRLEAEQQLASARNEAAAKLDFVASAGMVALWADDALPGLQLPGGRPAFVATGGLELELPIGSNAADARRDQARIQVESVDAQIAAQENSLRADLATRYQEAEAARDRIALTEESVRIATALADAERERLALGTTTAVNLLSAQQTAREALLRSLRAQVDAIVAHYQLEDLSGLLAERYIRH